MATHGTTSPTVRWGRKTSHPAEQRALKRRAVLVAAARAFNEKGFHGTSLDALARSLNITKPALYYYMKNKDEILLECLEIGVASVAEVVQQTNAAGHDGMVRMRLFCDRYAELCVTDFCICLIRNSDQAISPDTRRRIRDAKAGTEAIVAGFISGGIADGSIAPCDPAMVARALFSTMNALYLWYDPNGTLPLRDLANRLLEPIYRGLEPHRPRLEVTRRAGR